MSNSIEAYRYQVGVGEVRWMGETSTSFLATGALTWAQHFSIRFK